MSFFRRASEFSQSEDTSSLEASSSISVSDTTRSVQGNGQLVTAASGSSVVTEHHQNVLLHSLLEEKCLHDTAQQLNEQRPRNARRLTKDDPEVIVQAKERYRVLAEQLIGGGLLSRGMHGEDYRHLRQTARDGIDALSRNFTALEMSQDLSGPTPTDQLISLPVRRLLQDTDQTSAMANYPVNTQAGGRPLDLVPQLLPSHPLLDSARYTRDFEELGFVDKGGFGSVYRVNHRLDGRSYAIKKIVLSSAVVQRVRQRGQSELDVILRELRLMARLEHPNLVRYFSGWIEWSRSDVRQDAVISDSPLSDEINTDSGDDSGGHDDLAWHAYDSGERSQSASAGADIVFEVSESSDVQDSTRSNDRSVRPGTPSSTGKTKTAGPVVSRPEDLHRTNTRSTTATVTDDDIEEITRSPLPVPTTHAQPSNLITQPPLPSLILHIQMSLYPLTLTHYLHRFTPDPISAHSPTLSLRHCYHLPAAVLILLSILDGVEYLHRHDIIHCDLKPANIFLTPTLCASPTSAPNGSVNLAQCAPCRGPHSPQHQQQQLHLGVCVGDFGLATPSLLKDCVALHSRHRAVGTELYRPPETDDGGPDAQRGSDAHSESAPGQTTSTAEATELDPGNNARTAHPSQDVYALGIIFVELLCPFGTRMERGTVLRALREEGRVPLPPGMYGDGRVWAEVRETVGWMLDWRGNGGDTVELRRRLVRLRDLAVE